jgi:transposase, IS5 family
MGQLGFFDADKRLAAISAKGDPLEMIDRVVPFERFRAEIEAVVLTPAEDKKSSAGRKPIAKGYIARGGQMVDATIVPVPKQRNSREENEAVKAGKTPKEWQKNPAKNQQKDKDARWTKKHGKSFYGYKNHVNADAKHKLIRHYEVTDASVHDSRKFYGLLNKANTSADVYADSAYRSAATEAKLKVRGLRSRIHQRASRNHTLSKAQENANHKKSKVRARVEHVFGAQQTSPGGRIVRTIGIVRAKAKIGLQNLANTIRRLVTLERMVAAA